MSMTWGPRDYRRFDELAEEFAQRYRRGERPGIQEYVDRLPEMADEIREMFPALIAVEQVERDARDEACQPSPAAARLRQIGDYRILREVGRGGMGVVYEAEQISLGRRVALKVLPVQKSGDRVIEERFRREARAAAKLHHTNIVPVYEVGQDGGARYYAMQFIDGLGLDAVITELNRLLEDRARSQIGIVAASGGRSRRRRGEPSRHGIDTPTLGGGVEVSAVLRSILTGRFDPGGRGPDLAEGSPSMTAGTVARGLAASREIGRESRGALFDRPPSRTGADIATVVDSAGSQATHRLEPEFSTSGSSSSPTSAILPGGTQLSSVEAGRRAFIRSLAQIGRQVAGALAYAHARRIVHRDIKPSNLLLDTEGVVWIADFGLAKGEDEGLTQSGDILGTIRYMAPERFRGEGDARADVYALGLTIYELLTLHPAFTSSDRLKLIEQIKTEEPPRPRTIDARIPRDLETIVLKAIEKDPEARYQTAEAMGDDLGRFLADEPIKARQVSALERYWRWARRNPLIAGLVGAVAALLIVVAFGSIAAAAYSQQLARREQVATRKAIEERDISRRLALDKGFALAEEGQADRGLHWMLEALKTAPEEAVEFRRMVRWNMGAWLGQVHKPLRIIETGGPSDYLAFSHDGKAFATLSKRNPAPSIDLWETGSGRKLRSFPGVLSPFAFRPGGKMLLACDEKQRLVAIDLVSGSVLWTTTESPKRDHSWDGIAFSPDGSTVLALRHDGSDRAWLLRFDTATGQQRGDRILGLNSRAAIAPDGKTVATERREKGELHIDVYELNSGRRAASWRVSGAGVDALLFGPDGKSLFVGLFEGDQFTGRRQFGQLWDPAKGAPRSLLIARTTAAMYAPSSDRLVTTTNNMQVTRDATTGVMRGSRFPATSASAHSLASHPDGRTMLVSDSVSTVRLWQVSADAEPVLSSETDGPRSVTRSGSNQERRASRFFTTLSADGQVSLSLTMSAGGRKAIRLSDPATGCPRGSPALQLRGWSLRAVAISPGGNSFATGSHPDGRVAGEVRLWDAKTGRLLLSPMQHTNYVSALAFHPDGTVLAAGDFSGLVRTWDTSTGKEIGRPLNQGEIVLTLAYSPDGKTLAVGLSDDHTGRPGIRLWDAVSRQPRGELLPANDVPRRLEFRPDGQALLAVHNDHTQLWDAIHSRAIGKPMVDEAAAGFSPNGRAFLTLGTEGTVKLREASTGAILTTLLTSASLALCASYRSDGGLIAVGFEDGTVRLCDPATSQPVGPPRHMRHAVGRVVFTSDGRTVAAIDEEGESRTWTVPEPVPASGVDDLTLLIEARTGLHKETGLAISRLDAAAWRERLGLLGRLDPSAVRPDDNPAWHGPMIREAEQNGNTFAAIWHLDQLIADRPDDWFLRARRARAWATADQFDKAEQDYLQAERRGKREEVLDFQTHCEIECSTAERWFEALWYLDRLILARPDDAWLHEERAAVYGKLGREADRLAEVARVFELGVDEGLVIPRAEELGRAGRWAEAARLLARCGRTGPLSRELAQAWAVACLKAGDRAGYRAVCAAIMAGQGPDPAVVWSVLNAASLFGLGADGLDDYRLAMGWLEHRLSAVPAPHAMYRHLFSSALGGLLLRAGRVDEAIVRLNEGISAAAMELPTDWAYLALAHAKKGDLAEARRWLDRLRASPHDPNASFWDLQELALLWNEAESLLFDAGFPSDPFHGPKP